MPDPYTAHRRRHRRVLAVIVALFAVGLVSLGVVCLGIAALVMP